MVTKVNLGFCDIFENSETVHVMMEVYMNSKSHMVFKITFDL